MTDDEVIQISFDHFAGLFPKTCPCCGRCFATFREYVLASKPVGVAISYDAEVAAWKPAQPIGAFALANCPCGSTLTVTTEGIPLPEIHLMLEWMRVETERRGVNPSELLEHVRDEVRKRALAEPDH
jgi:hypothetical protein